VSFAGVSDLHELVLDAENDSNRQIVEKQLASRVGATRTGGSLRIPDAVICGPYGRSGPVTSMR
jgi:hypothetical protein